MTSIFHKPAKMGFLLAGLVSSIAVAQTQGLATAEDQQQVWNLSATLAQATKGEGSAVIDVWPGGNIAMPRASTGTLSVVDGGTFGVGQGIRARDSEVRLSSSGKVRLVTLDLEGSCITRKDVRMRYPDAKVVQIPSGHSLDELTYYAVNIDNVRVSFGFTERNPDCLDGIVVNPEGELPTK